MSLSVIKDLFIVFSIFLLAESHVRKTRMTYADPTTVEKYPYLAYGGHCTASIIHERYLLSALHCYQGANPADVSFWVGVDDRNNVSEGVQHFAEAIFERNNGSLPYTPGDIVLIRLTQPITFNSRAQPIKLNKSLVFTPKETITVTGFGATEFGGYSQELREGTFTLTSSSSGSVQMESSKNGLGTVNT
uniref:Peptidase S1 domain-containing protein n=1 Tax=Panagrolaimus sp. ES5 TaxID=591445 RepID=A0AC34FD70_9BILA